MLPFGDNTPVPTPTMTVDPTLVTPGFVGFAFMALLVVVVVFLIWDMNRRIRRVRYRAEVREELDAEQADAAQAETPTQKQADKPDPEADGR
jgi:flagellar biosynthesis/type III secretory pathway M-ring protein FliF/YscJ